MKFIFIILLIVLVLIFPINISMAENNNSVKSLTGFGWSMGLSLTSDEIYVADGLYNKILVFSKSDIEKNFFNFADYENEYFLNENRCKGHIHGISVIDERIYVVKNNSDCIAVFDLSGNFINEFGKTGNKNGEFDGPQNLEIFNDKIFVVDTGNNRIQIFDLSGNFINEFGKTGNKNGEFDGPQNLEIFNDKIFVVDTGNNRIQIFDLSGNFINDIKADFKIPHQIVVDEERIYVLDTYNYEIKIFPNSNTLNSKNYTTQNDDYEIQIVVLLIVIFLIIISYRFLKRKFS